MNDQQLCEIVHDATASGMFPRGTHSGETMAVARAVRDACIAEALKHNTAIEVANALAAE